MKNLKRKKMLIFLVLGCMFVYPKFLEELALFMKILRGIAAYIVLQIWVKGGVYSGRISSPLHKWLRSVVNGNTKKALEEFLIKLDLPDT